MMSKKDYNAIAALLKSIRVHNKMTARESTLLAQVALALSSYMQMGNPKFSRDRFLAASSHPAFEE